MQLMSKQYSYLEIFQLMKTIDLRGIENFYFHDKDFFTIQCMPKVYLTIKFPSTIFISDVKLPENIETKSKQILRKYCKRQFGEFKILERERVIVFENEHLKLVISLFLKGNIQLYIKASHNESANIKKVIKEEDDLKLIYSMRKESFDINEKSIEDIPKEIDELDFSKDLDELSKDISKILLIPNKISKKIIDEEMNGKENKKIDELKIKKNIIDFFEEKYKKVSKCYINTKSEIELKEIKSILSFYSTNKEITDIQKDILKQWFKEFDDFNIYEGEIEFENISEVLRMIYTISIILNSNITQIDPKKISLEKSTEKQEKSIISLDKKSKENQMKGEQIYEHYSQLTNLMNVINLAIKNQGIKKVKEIISKSDYKDIIKSIDEKEKKIIVDIDKLNKKS